jgi:D-glycero-alpha-D-manno-heptose-7-phosphate kinase
MADVPDGTGLGSSGSYLVSLLTALHELKREKISTQALAEEACHIEIDLAQHPVGKQDQYLAAFGGITHLDIEQDGKVKIAPSSTSLHTAEALRSRLLLFFTGISRSSREILLDQQEKTRQGNSTVIESLHYIKELGHRIKEALEEGEVDRFGLLLDGHWQAKKRLSSKVSDGRIDRWYDLAKANGAIGGKVAGAGGGGFLMLYCPGASKQRVRAAMTAEGLHEMSYDFDFEGAKVLLNI